MVVSLLVFSSVEAYPRTYNFRSLSVGDGISDLIVNAIYKDSTGYVWIGTGSSVERFDGLNIKHYPIPGSEESDKRVYAFIELPGGDLWMGNGTGLWRLDKAEGTWNRIGEGMIQIGVHALSYDGDNLYIGTENGLFVYHEGAFTHLPVEQDILSPAKFIEAMTLDGNGTLWMATNAGLYALGVKERTVTPCRDGDRTLSYNSIACLGTTVYLGTEDRGIMAYNTATGTFSSYIDVGCNVISTLSTDGKDLLYVGTDGNGIHFISTSQDRIVQSITNGQYSHGLRSNSVYSLLVDRDGIIWVGLYQMGLDYSLYHSELFTVYNYPPYFDSTDKLVRTIQIQEGEKLIGTREGFYYVDEKRGRFKHVTVPEIRSNMVLCSAYYHNEYYIGTYGGGMFIFNPATMTVRDFSPKQTFLNGQIFYITPDEADCLWVCTSVGLYRFKGNEQIAHYTSSNSSLPRGKIYQIYFDSDHKGWVLSDNGICLWDPSSQTLLSDVIPKGFIQGKRVRAMYEDSEHNLYFMPDRDKLFRSDLSMTSFGYIPSDTPLTGKNIMFIIEDRDGWLWIGTDNGMFRYDKHKEFVEYTFIDGIPQPFFINCPPVPDEKGGIWFGNTKGLLYWDISQMRRHANPSYPLTVTDVVVEGNHSKADLRQKGEKAYILSLNHAQKTILVSVSDFTYSDPSNSSYEWKPDKGNANWEKITAQSPLALYEIAAGSHLLRIRCVGKPQTEISLLVKRAYPVKAWHLILAAVIIAAACYIYRRKHAPIQTGKKAGAGKGTVEMPVYPGQRPTETKPTPSEEEKYRNYKMSEADCAALKAKLEKAMLEEKLYLRPDLKMADLALAVDVSSSMLSYYFNQQLKRNYYEYINDYRIEEFKSLVNGGEYTKYTISAMAGLCGFVSKTSFFRHFKKVTGITPNIYIQQVEKERQ